MENDISEIDDLWVWILLLFIALNILLELKMLLDLNVPSLP